MEVARQKPDEHDRLGPVVQDFAQSLKRASPVAHDELVGQVEV